MRRGELFRGARHSPWERPLSGFELTGCSRRRIAVSHDRTALFRDDACTPIVPGENFRRPTRLTAPRVAVVNEAFARRHLAGPESARSAAVNRRPRRAADANRRRRQGCLFSGSVRIFLAPPSVYVPYAQSSPSRATFEVAVAGNSLPAASHRYSENCPFDYLRAVPVAHGWASSWTVRFCRSDF